MFWFNDEDDAGDGDGQFLLSLWQKGVLAGGKYLINVTMI